MNATAEPTARVSNTSLFFDATCGLCCAAADRWRETLQRRGVAVLPLQGEEAKRELCFDSDAVPDEMKFVNGANVYGGADAFIEIARRIWWARPIAIFAAVPGTRAVLRRAYAALAARRHCLSGACRIGPTQQPGWIGYVPLLALPLVALALRNAIPDWAFMWALAFAMFAGCKWLTWWRVSNARRVSPLRSLAFLLGWIGMDADRFLSSARAIPKPRRYEWIAALGKTLFGVVLVWGVVPSIPGDYPILRGWCGLLGIVFLLHFGTFHLLALAWRACGIDAQPIMRAPVLATSLSDFWNRRWNLAFHQLAEREIFKPLRRRTNIGTALFVTFALSGLIHDAVISFPARAGYGAPTCYFLLQGGAVLFERSALGKRVGLNGGWRGRAFAWLVTIAPVPLLFHRPFITQIILPFLDAIGAL